MSLKIKNLKDILNEDRELFESAILGKDEKYLEYLESVINDIETPINEGYDIEMRGPMDTRVFLDFLYETLRRFHLYKNSEEN
jgi:hypothetical protein